MMNPRWKPFFDDKLSPSASLRRIEAEDVRDGDVIELRQLRKTFVERGQKHEALRGIDLNVRRGEIHGILGRSGAGKSTLLRCLLRLEKPDSGQMLIDGRDWVQLPEKQLRLQRHRIGVVFQHLDLLSSRTVADNVAFPLELAGAGRGARRERALELLQWFGIAEKADQYPSRLSGGQRQRVALARALAASPTVLLADEPTSALDKETKASVLKILRRIRDEFGVSILLITHDLHAAAALCDRLSLLEEGEIVERGTPTQLLLNPQTEVARRLFTGATISPDVDLLSDAFMAESETEP